MKRGFISYRSNVSTNYNKCVQCCAYVCTVQLHHLSVSLSPVSVEQEVVKIEAWHLRAWLITVLHLFCIATKNCNNFKVGFPMAPLEIYPHISNLLGSGRNRHVSKQTLPSEALPFLVRPQKVRSVCGGYLQLALFNALYHLQHL